MFRVIILPQGAIRNFSDGSRDERIHLSALAELTEGMSAAEFQFVCGRAAMNAIGRNFPAAIGGLSDIAACASNSATSMMG
jgi:SpoVK/Ycf46/Vps4 family AAA+-type ATPase